MIPAITHPKGRYWTQPSREAILVDDVHALMTEAVFERLPEYSATVPTGVYEGKMWRRHDGLYANIERRQRNLPDGPQEWLLCWYGPSDQPDHCSINYRKILLV